MFRTGSIGSSGSSDKKCIKSECFYFQSSRMYSYTFILAHLMTATRVKEETFSIFCNFYFGKMSYIIYHLNRMFMFEVLHIFGAPVYVLGITKNCPLVGRGLLFWIPHCSLFMFE